MLEVASFIQRCSIVKKIPVFSFLSWFRIQGIARAGELVQYRKGEAVCRKGAAPDFVYFLISGRLQAYIPDNSGSKNDLEFIHRGMFFGIISALTGQEHSQTFEAMNDSVIFRIQVSPFRKILKQIPELSLKFSKVLSQRIRSKLTRTELVSKSTIISVYAPISGSGGSTYAVNLATSLARESGDKVIWVSIRSGETPVNTVVSDIDEIRPKWKREPKDIAALVRDFENIPQHVMKSDIGIDLLNAHFDPHDKSIVDLISEFVSRFIDEYRYVIVDLPSNMDEVVMKTLSQSDFIHLVMLRKRETLESGRAVLNRIEEALKEDFNDERVKVIIGGVHIHRNISEETVRSILDFEVAAFLPHIQRKDLALMLETDAVAFMALSRTSIYARQITSMARQIAGVSVGLVLGGGAAFGLAHIGVIKVLEEEGIGVDVIVGSSMGALIGGLWAVGYRAADIEKMALEFRKRSNLIKLIDLVFPLSGLISGKAVMAWLYSKYGKRTFRDTKIPFKVVAYDLIHRRDVVMDEGPLVQAIRKSISIPGVFQPIITKDQLIIDGGVMNPLPTNVLVASDVKRIIAVNVLQTPEDVIKGYEKTQAEILKAAQVSFVRAPLSYITTHLKFWMNRRFFPNISDIIVRTLEASESVLAQESGRAADVLIHPDLAGLNWYELYQAEELIKRGEEAARKHLEQLRRIARHK
jgi:NTE family protein